MSNKTLLQSFLLVMNPFVCHKHYHTEVLNNSVRFVAWLQKLDFKWFFCGRAVAPRESL